MKKKALAAIVAAGLFPSVAQASDLAMELGLALGMVGVSIAASAAGMTLVAPIAAAGGVALVVMAWI